MSSGITVSPAFQEVTLLATQSSTVAEVTFVNESPEEVLLAPSLGELVLETKEGFPVTEFIPRQVVPSLPYAELLTKEVKIAPQQSAKISVSLKNNQALSPGGHYLSIVVPVRVANQDTQQLIPTVTSTIFLTKKGGETYHLDLLQVKSRTVQFFRPSLELQFDNTGNTHAVPYGKVIAQDMFRRNVFSAIINEDSLRVFPGQQRSVAVSLNQKSLALPISWYRVTIDGRVLPGDTPYTAGASVLLIQPLQLILWIVVLSVVLAVTWKKRQDIPGIVEVIKKKLFKKTPRQFEKL